MRPRGRGPWAFAGRRDSGRRDRRWPGCDGARDVLRRAGGGRLGDFKRSSSELPARNRADGADGGAHKAPPRQKIGRRDVQRPDGILSFRPAVQTSSSLRAACNPNRPAPVLEQMIPERGEFRPDIEGLRGVAILLVVAFHAGVSWLAGGYVGVDVFFVLSGFLITGMLAREVVATGDVDFAEFYARRARRLLPALVVVLARDDRDRAAGSMRRSTGRRSRPTRAPSRCTTATSCSRPAPSTITRRRTIRSSTRGRSPWRSSSTSCGRCSSRSSVACGSQRQRGRDAQAPVRRRRDRGRGVVRRVALGHARRAAVGVLRHADAHLGVRGRRHRRARARSTQSSEGRARRRDACRSPDWSRSARRRSSSTRRRRIRASPRCCPSPAPPRCSSADVARPTARQRGARRARAPVFRPRVVLVVSLALAARRARRGDRLGDRRRRTHRVVARRARARGADAIASSKSPHDAASCSSRARSWVNLAALGASVALAVDRVRRDASPRARSASTPVQRRFAAARDDGMSHDCWGSLLENATAPCVFGDVSSRSTVVLFGDSHAEHWLPAMDRLGASARVEGRRDDQAGVSRWPTCRELVNTRLKRYYSECTAWRRAMLRRIVAMRPDRRRALELRPLRAARRSDADWQISPTQWRAGLRRTYATFSRAPASTRSRFVERRTPGSMCPSCLSRRASGAPFSDKPCEYDFARSLVPSAVAAQNDGGARLCDGGVRRHERPGVRLARCAPVVRNGAIVFRDGNHLTATFSRDEAPVLGAAHRRGAERAPPATVVIPSEAIAAVCAAELARCA